MPIMEYASHRIMMSKFERIKSGLLYMNLNDIVVLTSADLNVYVQATGREIIVSFVCL